LSPTTSPTTQCGVSPQTPPLTLPLHLVDAAENDMKLRVLHTPPPALSQFRERPRIRHGGGVMLQHLQPTSKAIHEGGVLAHIASSTPKTTRRRRVPHMPPPALPKSLERTDTARRRCIPHTPLPTLHYPTDEPRKRHGGSVSPTRRRPTRAKKTERRKPTTTMNLPRRLYLDPVFSPTRCLVVTTFTPG